MNLFQELSGHRVVLKSLAYAQIIRPMPDDDLILCPHCNEEKAPTEFYYRTGKNDPYRGQLMRPGCKSCTLKQRRKA